MNLVLPATTSSTRCSRSLPSPARTSPMHLSTPPGPRARARPRPLKHESTETTQQETTYINNLAPLLRAQRSWEVASSARPQGQGASGSSPGHRWRRSKMVGIDNVCSRYQFKGVLCLLRCGHSHGRKPLSFALFNVIGRFERLAGLDEQMSSAAMYKTRTGIENKRYR
jgi:hypothetical protein